jgi:MoxR-like ATPase
MNKEKFEELFKKNEINQGKSDEPTNPVITENLKTLEVNKISSERTNTVEIDGVTLHLSHPDEVPMKWVGQTELKTQLKAAWLVLHEKDYPLNPRLLGKPGVGKTTLAYSTAKELNKEVYIFQATMDTRPEDLLISPVVTSNQQIKYVASPLVTAMIRGGVIILDEGNRMSEKSWASLAPLLDGRRYIESIVAGIKVSAHPEFRFVATMNDDASTFEIPEYIHSRLQPQIIIDFPEKEEELLILRENLPFMKQKILEYIVDFLQKAHKKDERYTVRDGINIARYAGKLMKAKNLSENLALKNAVIQVLGQEALVHLHTDTK